MAAAFSLLCLLAPAPSISGKGTFPISYDGSDIVWDYRGMPHEIVHFDIYYENGHETFWSTITLDRPEHWVPPYAGCGWQDWVAYSDTGILNQGSIFVCKVDNADA